MKKESQNFLNRLRNNPGAELSPDANEMHKKATDLFCKIINLFITINGKVKEEEAEAVCKEQMEPIYRQFGEVMLQLPNVG